MGKPPQRLARRTIYDSPWVTLHIDRVEMPGGSIVEEHHLIEFRRQSVGAIVVDGSARVLLIEALRYAVPGTSWEVPAGRIEEGESPMEAAAREVLEETGYETAHHRELYRYYPVSGISSGVFTIVVCDATQRVGDIDRDEVASMRWADGEEIARMIAAGEILDGLTLTALLLHAAPARTPAT